MYPTTNNTWLYLDVLHEADSYVLYEDVDEQQPTWLTNIYSYFMIMYPTTNNP
jgi:hypothetical protein